MQAFPKNVVQLQNWKVTIRWQKIMWKEKGSYDNSLRWFYKHYCEFPRVIFMNASQKFNFTFSLYLPVLPIQVEMHQATFFQAHIASAVMKFV